MNKTETMYVIHCQYKNVQNTFKILVIQTSHNLYAHLSEKWENAQKSKIYEHFEKLI